MARGGDPRSPPAYRRETRNRQQPPEARPAGRRRYLPSLHFLRPVSSAAAGPEDFLFFFTGIVLLRPGAAPVPGLAAWAPRAQRSCRCCRARAEARAAPSHPAAAGPLPAGLGRV